MFRRLVARVATAARRTAFSCSTLRKIQEHLQALSRPSVRHLERLQDALTGWTGEQRAPSPETLAYSAGVPARIGEVLLSDLEEAAFVERDLDGGITVVVPPDKFAAGVRELIAKLKTFRYEGERRLRLMADYAQSKECRSVFIRRYFGEDHSPRCGTCDRCRADQVAATPASPSRKARQQNPAQAPPRMHAPLREPATPAARGLVRGEGPATAGSENARPRKRWQRSRTKKTARK
jgi:RecQ zinc-binding